jgi:ATP-binding cassette subfamily C protein
MNAVSRRSPIQAFESTLASARRFICDFWRWAGFRGVMAIGLSAIAAALEGGVMILLIPVLARIEGQPAGQARFWIQVALNRLFQVFAVEAATRQLQWILVAAAILAVLRAVALSRREAVSQQLQYGFLGRQQVAVIEALANAPWATVSCLQHARITNMLGAEVQRVGAAATGLVEAAAALIVLATYLLMAVSISPVLTLAALAIGSAPVALSIATAARARRLGESVADGHLALLHNTGQFLSALKLARSQGLQHPFVRQFRDRIDELYSYELTFIRRRGAARIRWTLCGVALGSIIVFVAFDVLRLNAVLIFPLLVLLSRLSGPVIQLQHYVVQLARTLPAYERWQAMLEELAPPPARAPARPQAFGDIEFRAVGYRHARDGAAPAKLGGVEGLSLRIAQGACVGMAGRSGAGKTTCADLLAGLYAPQSGEIRIAGRCADLVDSAEWRKALAYVAQEAFLANDSLRANLLWGAETACEEDIRQALSVVEAETLLARLPAGLETLAGERGSLFSGGERQRIALARALLRKPQLLILDEATNALDIESENRLMSRIRQLLPSLTILLIAHRPETLRHADRVIVLDRGRVVEEGGYADVRDRLPELMGRPPASVTHPSPLS